MAEQRKRQHPVHRAANIWMAFFGVPAVLALSIAPAVALITDDTSPHGIAGRLLIVALSLAGLAFPGWMVSMGTMGWKRP
jgi:hypothetical protein